MTLADVHVEAWAPHPQASPLMMRMEGYLRPAGLALPQVHPIYGDLGQGNSYVDQGAFELFKPLTVWPGIGCQKILVVIHCWETLGFPNTERKFSPRLLYRGLFSQDGLARHELPGGHSVTSFLSTDGQDGDEVLRPALETITHYASNGAVYWPLEAYIEVSVPGRSTTLNEQRYMQLLQGIKALLGATGPSNPVHPNPPLTPSEIKSNVVFCVIGGSNGGMQSSLATLRYPHLLHGNFSSVINPSYQRLYAEFDLDRALTEVVGAGPGPRECGPEDFMLWDQYAWSQGLEMHDMSCLRSFIRGASYRPMCFAVGDEDTTSSGTNWARVIDGNAWHPYGLATSSGNFGLPSCNTFGWMAGDSVRHAYNVGPSTSPYTNLPAYVTPEVAVDFWPTCIAQRNAEIALGHSPPIPALVHEPRTPAQQLRGLDDPQEWWLGRLGQPIPPPAPNAPLVLDTAFSDAVNPGFTGSMPGSKEAMFIKEQRVYVGSADGFVTSFVVDNSPPNNLKQPLVKHARSPQLGFDCHGVAPVGNGSSWFVAATTRRHLHKLDKDTLQVVASVQLPWEVGRAHHVSSGDVLPGNPGAEIVFASVHGGLCFYDMGLQPIYEWPEPGIVDFFLEGGQVWILSMRGVVARVVFDAANQAHLLAVSNPISTNLGSTYGTIDNPACMGLPADLELMKINLSAVGLGVVVATASTWTGDVDRNAVRGNDIATLAGLTLVSIPDTGILDIATCVEANASMPFIGDHLLALLADGRLCLFDQIGNLQAATALFENQQGQHYPFGVGAHHMVVGDLVANIPGPYTQQVVIATNTGLMWMHINELLGNNRLPAQGSAQTHAIISGFWVEMNQGLATPLSMTNVQARTNQALQATWAMSRRPVGAVGTALDNDMHVLDQHGAYWKVGYSGQAQLWTDTLIPGVRGWDFVGSLVGGSSTLPLPHLFLVPLGQTTVIQTHPFCPVDPFNVAAESYPPPYTYSQPNWLRRAAFHAYCDGFMLHPAGGTALVNGGGVEIWHWTALGPGRDLSGTVEMQQWCNLVQAIRVNPAGLIDGVWASTAEAAVGNQHWKLRSHSRDSVTITQQAIAAVGLQGGGAAVVLGCPGGRVRVLVPGAMRVDQQTPHVLGGPAASTDDLGIGVSALAVRHFIGSGVDQLEIWFGTTASPDKRPSQYGLSGAALDSASLGAGALHKVTWSLGTGFSAVDSWLMQPSLANPRGASAVVGLLVGDVVQEPPLTPAEDELVVATLSGDIIVYKATTMTEIMRTWVPGGVGCYNGLRLANLGGGGGNELYVAGSCGLWRFVQQGG